jgi:hypothetical protein
MLTQLTILLCHLRSGQHPACAKQKAAARSIFEVIKLRGDFTWTKFKIKQGLVIYLHDFNQTPRVGCEVTYL